MKTKIYKLTSNYRNLLVLVLSLLISTAYSQTTHTFMYTGGMQTLALQAGSYSIQCWGAQGESAVNQPAGGIGGYSGGTYSVTAPTTIHIAVGGKGQLGTSSAAFANGGWNGGGQGYGSTVIGAGGGGASHVATATGVLSTLSSNQSAVIIVAGGAGGSGYAGAGGNGGGITGGNGNSGTGGNPSGAFGQGANGTTAGTCGGGGGGWFGGNLGSPGNTGGAGGGSGYIGGVTSGTTAQVSQNGFVANPDVSGNGLVLIKELCNIQLLVNGANSNTTICAGTTLTLSTDGVSSYSWSNSSSNSSITVTPMVTTVYTLSATSPSNCTASASRTIVVSSGPPVLSINASTTNVCLGESVTLTSTGALTYTWSHGVSNGVAFVPQSTQTYTVTGQNGCGIATATQSVAVAPLQVNVISTSGTVCASKPATLTAGGGNTYTWSTTQTGYTTIVAPAVSTVYQVTAQIGGCIGTASIQLSVDPNPTLTITGTSTNVCVGEAVTMTVTGADSYTWIPNTLTGTVVTVNPAGTSVYQVNGTNSLNCVAGSNYIVVTRPLPAIFVSPSATTTCPGYSVKLTAFGGINYQWFNGPGTASYVVNPSSTTVYTVTGTHPTNSCTAVKSATVNIFEPQLPVSADTTVCLGSQVTLTASSASSYTWSDSGGNANFAVFSPTTAKTYTVKGMVFNGQVSCPATASIDIAIQNLPVPTIGATKKLACRNETIQLTASSAAGYTWTGNGFNSSQTNNSNVVVSWNSASKRTFSVTVADQFGCLGTTGIEVEMHACAGLSENNKALSRLYPNPNKGVFTIECAADMQASIINELGQVVMHLQLVANRNNAVDLSRLENGIYFLVAKDQHSQVREKIIISK